MELFISIISLVLQPISIFVTYYLARKSDTISLVQNSYKERYNSFYAPYIQKIYAGFLWNKELILKMPFSTRDVFFDLISNNFKYLDTKSIKLYPKLYSLFLEMLDYEDCENENKYHNPSNEFAIIFLKISISILEESIIIADELKLPRIGEEILFSYSLLLNKLEPLK